MNAFILTIATPGKQPTRYHVTQFYNGESAEDEVMAITGIIQNALGVGDNSKKDNPIILSTTIDGIPGCIYIPADVIRSSIIFLGEN